MTSFTYHHAISSNMNQRTIVCFFYISPIYLSPLYFFLHFTFFKKGSCLLTNSLPSFSSSQFSSCSSPIHFFPWKEKKGWFALAWIFYDVTTPLHYFYFYSRRWTWTLREGVIQFNFNAGSTNILFNLDDCIIRHCSA